VSWSFHVVGTVSVSQLAYVRFARIFAFDMIKAAHANFP
jgi:hypothetical protein